MSRILCVWLPNWPIQRVLASEPMLVGRAVVLETRDARRGLVIAAANLAARQAGARVGMRLSELAALKSDDDKILWEVRPYHPDQDLDALCDLAEQAQQFSPLVGLELHDQEPWHGRTSCQPQALLLDASGIADLFGGDQPYLAEIAAWLRSQRYFAYMALASTIGAAWALANYELLSKARHAPPAPPAPQPPAATISSAAKSGAVTSDPSRDAANRESDKTDYVPLCRTLVTDPWEEAELLSELPVAALRIDSETVGKLRRLGVGSLAQLWQLPRDGLASRLGSRLMRRSDQALGLAAEAVIALHGADDWSADFSLEHPTLSTATLNQVLQQLCTQLAERLTRAGLGALRCLCRLDLVRQSPLVMQLGLFRPSDDPQHLHLLLAGQLEQVLQGDQDQRYGQRDQSRYGQRSGDPPPDRSASLSKQVSSAPGSASAAARDEQGMVWRVVLQATLVGPIVWQQTQLFEQSDPRYKQQLAQLIDSLSGRLGRGQVLEAHMERDAEPEQAVTYRPLTGRRPDGVEQATLRKLTSRLATSGAEPRPTDPLRRPTHLITPPEPLIGAATCAEGLIRQFVYENRRLVVTAHWGPERLESGWWRGPSLRRDYYRIEATDGSWWWVFRELSTGQWFMHGTFG
ncbi:MAG: DNA polymerase Y family protein [Pirellulaceae bacterium]|nr:DNA polymerase Y family protein [Pirellulaceae bacterium]